MQTKICSKCGELKPLTTFARQRGAGPLQKRAACRKCLNIPRRGRGNWVPIEEPKLSVPVLAYLAGFIDGEGSIRLSLWTQRGQGRKPGPRREVLVQGWNTNPAVMDWLMEHVPGGRVTTKQQPNPKWKPELKWSMATRRAIWLLPQILPYLTIKRPHAEACLEFYGLMRAYREAHGTHVPHPLPKDIQVVADRVALLNRKGPHS